MSIQRTRWHWEADVVVIGYGAAGAAAAITAHDGGAQIIILEKQDARTPITTSLMSGGLFICPTDIQEACRYMEALYKVSEDLYWTEPDIIRVWADYTAENKKWFESMGGKTELYRRGGQHRLPGVESIDVYRARGIGSGMMRVLYDQVTARGIQVMHGMSATGLLMNSNGEVIGVKAKQCIDEGKEIDVHTRRAVILATGGFEFDEQMKLQYLRVYPSYFTATPANTGDGIRMALGVGAQLWHMNCVAAGFVMKFPELPTGLSPVFGGKHWRSTGSSALPGFGAIGWQAQHANLFSAIAGYIVVDRSGKRYTDENFKPHSLYYELMWFDSQRMLYPRVPSYWVFDQRRMDDGPLVRRTSGPAGPARFYKWSSDNSEELERGWIRRGDTIQELALRLDIKPQTLAETVTNYNLYCEHGEDVECNREPSTLTPLATPPYYAVELWPGGMNTQGGPRRDRKAQVLRADGAPIPRLYSAGELGSIYGMLYPSGGGNLAECFAFGRIAGENASGHHPL
ncbi:FAD-dependent oxidoreductase [Thermodesulfobacteriota bacterium]